MSDNNEDISAKVLKDIQHAIKREKEERVALALNKVKTYVHEPLKEIGVTASDTLKRLKISITHVMPQKYQKMFHEIALIQTEHHMHPTDSAKISLLSTEKIVENLDLDYEILKLKQKNQELQAKIDSNDKLLKRLREELASSKELLSQQSPNPDNIDEHIRMLKQKVASYEESCNKANQKFSKLNLPDALSPGALKSVISTLTELSIEEKMLEQRAEDVRLAREARNTLAKLALTR